MNTTTHTINCAHCKNKHATVGEVKDCARGIQRVPAAVEQSVLPASNGRVGQDGYITIPQFNHLVNDLGADPETVKWYTLKWASKQIAELRQKRKAGVAVTEPAPNRVTTIVPLDMLLKLRDGYYAAQQDETYPHSFFYVKRPTSKTSNYKNALVIKTQHGDDLKLMMVVYDWASENPRLYVHNKVPENDLLLVVVDPNQAGMEYADKIGHCMICNKDLTDPRSRWYGIGPDCEKRYGEIIDIVNDRKGVFVYGR